MRLELLWYVVPDLSLGSDCFLDVLAAPLRLDLPDCLADPTAGPERLPLRSA